MNFESNYKKLEEFAGVLFVVFSGLFLAAIFKMNGFLTFPNFDEMLWHFRSRFFWDRMLNFDFSGLIQSAQPGITVYWFTGFMMKFINFDFTTIPRLIAEKKAEGIDFSFINDNDPVLYKTYESISFTFNTPLFLLMIVFFITFYYLLKKLGFNRVIATFSVLFLASNMALVYWNTPSDKMLNIFITLSFLTLLVYLEKKDKKRYLVFSAILGSWAVLSKLSALFILPFFFIMMIFYSWPLDMKKIKKIFVDHTLWVIIFLAVSIIFFPSIILHPEEVYGLFFRSKFISGEENNVLVDFGKFAFYLDYYVKSFFIVGYVAPAGAVSFLAYIVLKLNKKHKDVIDSLPRKHLMSLSVYAVFCIVTVFLFSEIRDIRYMSPALIAMSVLAAAGLYGAGELVKKRLSFKSDKFFYASLILAIIFSQAAFFILEGSLMKLL